MDVSFGPRLTEMVTGYFEDIPDNSINLKKYETNKGDLICFDSYIPHASYKNKSNNKRIIVFFTYTPKANGDLYERYHADKFKNVPQILVG